MPRRDHGLGRTPEYKAWRALRYRCNSPLCASYPGYGGRGISVCDRWQRSFRDFLADMGPRPSPDHSIDRINNDGNYEPGNCRWSTMKEQCANRRPPPASVLDVEARRQIACLRRLGISSRDIAPLYGVSSAYIRGECPAGGRKKARAVAPARVRLRATWKRGAAHPQAKIQERDAAAIKARLKSGEQATAIARSFGVKPSTVYNIKYGATWSHVETA